MISCDSWSSLISVIFTRVSGQRTSQVNGFAGISGKGTSAQLITQSGVAFWRRGWLRVRSAVVPGHKLIKKRTCIWIISRWHRLLFRTPLNAVSSDWLRQGRIALGIMHSSLLHSRSSVISANDENKLLTNYFLMFIHSTTAPLNLFSRMAQKVTASRSKSREQFLRGTDCSARSGSLQSFTFRHIWHMKNHSYNFHMAFG
jgi:filamentous hemagglutinin family protein